MISNTILIETLDIRQQHRDNGHGAEMRGGQIADSQTFFCLCPPLNQTYKGQEPGGAFVKWALRREMGAANMMLM